MTTIQKDETVEQFLARLDIEELQDELDNVDANIHEMTGWRKEGLLKFRKKVERELSRRRSVGAMMSAGTY